MNNELLQRVKTPCIGICSTGIGDSVCRGCKRYAHEVIDWNSYTEAQKRLIDQRLSTFLAQIIETRLQVINADVLKWQLDTQQIRYPQDKSPFLWAYALLRAGASQMTDLRQYGIALNTQYRGCDLRELRLAIDDEFYTLSLAHYERYFQIDPATVIAKEGV